MTAGRLERTGGAAGGARYRLFVPWVLLTVVCLALMVMAPGDEVVPFHLIWIGFALAYGFEPWPVPLTVVSLVTAAVTTGAVLLYRANAGVIAWEETTEIVLMVALAGLVAWHVRRRQAAMNALTMLVDHQLGVAHGRERLARLTSHEMRTPLTIASGYVDLLLAAEDREDRRDDLLVVHDELGRLARAGDRLLRMIRLEDALPRTRLDAAHLVRDTVTRWATVADRTWEIEAETVRVEASPERLRACLDTLIENAVRYTAAAGTIRVFCHQYEGHVWLGVADSGPGFTAEQTALINDGDAADLDLGAGGPGGQTGYGLGIVREIVNARGGLVRAGSSREGGALVLVVLPVAGRRAPQPEVLRASAPSAQQ